MDFLGRWHLFWHLVQTPEDGSPKHITGSHINGFRFFRIGQDSGSR